MLVCVSCSMQILEYQEVFTTADWVSVVLQFLFATILLSYVIFVTYFTVAKAGLWKTKVKGDQALGSSQVVEDVHKSILKKQLSKKSNKGLEKAFSVQLKQKRDKNEKLIMLSSTINQEQFEKYEPLVADLRKDS